MRIPKVCILFCVGIKHWLGRVAQQWCRFFFRQTVLAFSVGHLKPEQYLGSTVGKKSKYCSTTFTDNWVVWVQPIGFVNGIPVLFLALFQQKLWSSVNSFTFFSEYGKSFWMLTVMFYRECQMYFPFYQTYNISAALEPCASRTRVDRFPAQLAARLRDTPGSC